MKNAAALALLLATSCASRATSGRGGEAWTASGLPVLGPLQVALLYHQHAGEALPAGQLVHWYAEVCAEPDPAARKEAAASAAATLEAAAREAARTARWIVPLRQEMEGYDRQRGGFATPLRPGAAVRFDRSDYCQQDLSYLLAFENGDDYGVLRVDEAEALQLVRANPYRKVIHELEVEVVRAQRAPSPALVLRIVRMRTRDVVRGTAVADSAR